jgi:hypothetical protein
MSKKAEEYVEEFRWRHKSCWGCGHSQDYEFVCIGPYHVELRENCPKCGKRTYEYEYYFDSTFVPVVGEEELK